MEVGGAPKGCKQHGYVWLGCRNDLVGINGIRNKQSHFVGPPFPAFKACFSAMSGWYFSGDLTRCWLIGGCD